MLLKVQDSICTHMACDVLQALFSGLVRAGSRSFQRSASSAAALMPAGIEDALHAAAPASPASHGMLPAVNDATVGLTERSVVVQHQSLAFETAHLSRGADAQPTDAHGELRKLGVLDTNDRQYACIPESGVWPLQHLTKVCSSDGEFAAEPQQSLALERRDVRGSPAAKQIAADVRRSSRADRGMRLPVCLPNS